MTQGAPPHLLRSDARTASCWRPKRNSSHVKLLTWRLREPRWIAIAPSVLGNEIYGGRGIGSIRFLRSCSRDRPALRYGCTIRGGCRPLFRSRPYDRDRARRARAGERRSVGSVGRSETHHVRCRVAHGDVLFATP